MNDHEEHKRAHQFLQLIESVKQELQNLDESKENQRIEKLLTDTMELFIDVVEMEWSTLKLDLLRRKYAVAEDKRVIKALFDSVIGQVDEDGNLQGGILASLPDEVGENFIIYIKRFNTKVKNFGDSFRFDLEDLIIQLWDESSYEGRYTLSRPARKNKSRSRSSQRRPARKNKSRSRSSQRRPARKNKSRSRSSQRRPARKNKSRRS
jgi:hypothetical protein